MSYEKWPHINLSPLSILLDSENPRLPDLGSDADPDDIRSELFEISKVRELVKSIAGSGYFPDQDVVVIQNKKTKKYTVIEGNRRVCACQVLLKPKLTPVRHIKYIEKFVGSGQINTDSFRKIGVVVAPAREDATRLIVSRHLSGAPVQRWSRYAQGRFAINAFDDGYDIDYIKEETGLAEGRIRTVVREARLIRMFLQLDWNDDERITMLDHVETFPVDAILRVLRSTATHERFGKVEFDEDGLAKFSWSKSSIPALLKKFAYDAIPQLSGNNTKKLDTRIANNVEKIGEYLDDLPDEIKPKPVRRATSAASLADMDEFIEKAKAAAKTKPKRKKPVRQTPCLANDIECSLTHDKVRALLEELQTIKPDDFAHGSGMLLRVLVECALIARMRSARTWGDCVARYQKQPNTIPKLSEMIRFSSGSEKTIPDVSLRRSIADGQMLPKRLLDSIIHNDTHITTPTEVRDAATRLTPLLRYLLAP